MRLISSLIPGKCLQCRELLQPMERVFVLYRRAAFPPPPISLVAKYQAFVVLMVLAQGKVPSSREGSLIKSPTPQKVTTGHTREREPCSRLGAVGLGDSQASCGQGRGTVRNLQRELNAMVRCWWKWTNKYSEWRLPERKGCSFLLFCAGSLHLFPLSGSP